MMTTRAVVGKYANGLLQSIYRYPALGLQFYNSHLCRHKNMLAHDQTHSNIKTTHCAPNFVTVMTMIKQA